MGDELTGVLLVARGERTPGDTLTHDSGLPGLDPAPISTKHTNLTHQLAHNI